MPRAPPLPCGWSSAAASCLNDQHITSKPSSFKHGGSPNESILKEILHRCDPLKYMATKEGCFGEELQPSLLHHLWPSQSGWVPKRRTNGSGSQRLIHPKDPKSRGQEILKRRKSKSNRLMIGQPWWWVPIFATPLQHPLTLLSESVLFTFIKTSPTKRGWAANPWRSRCQHCISTPAIRLLNHRGRDGAVPNGIDPIQDPSMHLMGCADLRLPSESLAPGRDVAAESDVDPTDCTWHRFWTPKVAKIDQGMSLGPKFRKYHHLYRYRRVKQKNWYLDEMPFDTWACVVEFVLHFQVPS